MNYDAKTLARIIDGAGVATHHTDKGAAYIAEVYRDLLGMRDILRTVGTGATQVVANLAQVPATVISTKAQMYNVGGTTNKWKGKIDGGSSITVTLSSGATQTAALVAADFNADSNFKLVAKAVATSDKKVALVSLTSGLSSQIEVESVGNDCYSVVGFTAGITAGDMKAWDAARSTLVTKVGDALVQALIMLKLATNKTGSAEPEDYTQLATE